MNQAKASFENEPSKQCFYASKTALDELRDEVNKQASAMLEPIYLDQVLVRLCSSAGRITESNPVNLVAQKMRFGQGSVIIETSYIPLDMPGGICQVAQARGQK